MNDEDPNGDDSSDESTPFKTIKSMGEAAEQVEENAKEMALETTEFTAEVANTTAGVAGTGALSGTMYTVDKLRK